MHTNVTRVNWEDMDGWADLEWKGKRCGVMVSWLVMGYGVLSCGHKGTSA